MRSWWKKVPAGKILALFSNRETIGHWVMSLQTETKVSEMIRVTDTSLPPSFFGALHSALIPFLVTPIDKDHHVVVVVISGGLFNR
jgi:hypothetical protein